MSRSGHHAIIEWLASHMEDTILFVNDINTIPENINNQQILNTGNNGESYFFNLENFDPMNKFETEINPTDQDITETIFIHRFSTNLFASRIAHYNKWQSQYGDLDKFINDRAYHIHNLLNIWVDKTPDVFIISYELWLESEKYRQMVGEHFGLIGDFSKKYSKVSEYGKGSSFTGLDESKIQTQDERWKTLNNRQIVTIYNKTIPSKRVHNLRKNLKWIDSE